MSLPNPTSAGKFRAHCGGPWPYFVAVQDTENDKTIYGIRHNQLPDLIYTLERMRDAIAAENPEAAAEMGVTHRG